MLRLMDRIPAQGDRIVALGESMLDREQRGGVLMTIDVFPVRAVAEQAFTAVPTLLGRAIAHEIGHLLLGSAEHPRSGLMRALGRTTSCAASSRPTGDSRPRGGADAPGSAEGPQSQAKA